MKRGHGDFSAVAETVVGEYISYSAGNLCPGSLRNVISNTRKFYDFLKAKGEIDIAYEGFFSVGVRRPEKIRAAATREEVDAVLAQINRATPLGKRDYAAILLGARMGLRAADIINLKLRDVDWREDKIRLKQQKTGGLLIMPLHPEAGEAMHGPAMAKQMREYVI